MKRRDSVSSSDNDEVESFESGESDSTSSNLKYTKPKRPKKALPKHGVKDFVLLENSAEQQTKIEDSQERWLESLNEQRIHKMKLMSRGEWIDSASHVVITQQRGKITESLGEIIDSKICLYPEEAAHLVDKGMLQLFHNKRLCSAHDAYTLLLNTGYPIDYFIVYSYLKRFGYVVRRHDPKLYQYQPPAPPKLTKKQQQQQKAKSKTTATTATTTPLTTTNNNNNNNNTSRGWWPEQQFPSNLIVNRNRTSNNNNNNINDDIEALASDTRYVEAMKQMYRKLALVEKRTLSSATTTTTTPPPPQINQQPSSPPDQNQTSYTIVFDVYKPGVVWRRKQPTRPYFAVCVSNYNQPVPSLANLEQLEQVVNPPLPSLPLSSSSFSSSYAPTTSPPPTQTKCPIVFAVVEAGATVFFRLNPDIMLPTVREQTGWGTAVKQQ